MTKLEQVIKALQLCRYDPDPGQECKFLVSCDICPYWKDEFGCREVDLFNDALELLKAKDTNVPTKWVSVKDRLPTDAGIYIICDHYGNVMSRHFCKSHGKFAGYWHANGSAKYGNPLYWMPLPEPPKEEEDA